MVNIKPTINVYDAYSERPKLSKEYNKAISKMIDQTFDIDLEQFDFDEVAKGKCKEFDDLVTKLCAKSGLGSADIYSMLLERFIAEYDMDYDVNYVYGLDELEESKKTTKRSLKENKDEYDIKYDLVINALRLCWKADLILEDTYKRYKNKSVKIKNIDDAYDFAYTILYGKENDMLKAFHELMNLLHIEDFEKHFDL